MKDKEANRLIYEKSNNYRLHADNLRWTLLGGYAAFFTAAATLLSSGRFTDPAAIAIINSILFIASNLYLLMIAVQNWFYNLFAKFVMECEDRLSKGQDLRPLEEFAVENGKNINPFHPAFFFGELIIAFTSFYFLISTFASPLKNYLDFATLKLPSNLQFAPIIFFILIAIILFLIYLWVINHFLFRRWNDTIYKHIIKRFSNLWQQPSVRNPTKKKSG